MGFKDKDNDKNYVLVCFMEEGREEFYIYDIEEVIDNLLVIPFKVKVD